MLSQYSNQNINWNAYCNGTHSITLLPTVGTVLTAEVVVNFENFFDVILVAN